MSGIYIFDNSQNLYKTIPDKKILANYQEQELNGLISGTCQVKYSSDLEDAFFYGVKDEDKFWLYSIKNVIKKENTITFKGVHIMYDDLKGKVVRDIRPNDKLVGSVCTSILVGTGWECISHCNVRGSANFYYQSSLSALYKIAQKFGVDFIPVIKFSDGKIVAKQIHIYSKLGEDLGKVFSYEDNLVQVVAETSSDELFTAFIGRGKGETKTDDNGKATGGYGRKIKFDSIDYKDTIDGITVHSPIGSDIIEIKEATRIYGYPDGSPRICTVDFGDIEDKRELAIATFKYAIEHSRPRVQLRAKGNAYERIGIGEIVTIIGPMDIRFKTRIFKLKKDFLSKKILDFEFGDKIVKSMSDRLKENQTDSKVDEINEISFMDSIFTMIESTYYNEDGYQYDLKPDNKYKLPAGLYSFNKPIDQNPDKVIYFGAGKLMIANSKKDDGSWNFRVALNGDSVNADVIRAGILRGGKVHWNLEDGTLLIGNDPADYNLYWDGSTLFLRNVDIDLENNKSFKDLSENVDKKVTDIQASLKITNETISAKVSDLQTNTESKFTQLKDEISLEVSSQNGVYKNLIKNAWKWGYSQGIYWYPQKDDKGVAQGGPYYIESNGDLRFTSNKKANTWTVFNLHLVEMEAGIKEYTVICEPSEMKDTLQYPQFRLTTKDHDFITNYSYFNKKDRVYKIVINNDKLNELPKQLRISFKDSQEGTDKDRSIVIPQGKLALVKGWHPNLTWNEVYTPNEQAIEEVRSELKVKTDKISASVSDKVKGLESRLDIQSDQISSKVSNYQFGTKVRQSATDIQIAWNNISKYIQFEHGSIGIYDGSVISSKKRSMFDENGIHFYRDGYYVGKIGTNQWKNNNYKKGLVFDLEYEGAYMTWASKDSKHDDAYTVKWLYAKNYFDGYSSDTLNAGCDIDMNGHKLKNVDFEGGGLTGNLHFAQITSMNSDGTVNEYSTCNLNFQNGILVGGSWVD
ncbi:phage tail spike protein [Anaerococcus tetradius]|uniref:Phage minor structural protein n=1 Tax=Anaerococcus tetradius TaxID=33036 RepID=A0A133KDD4_9FIRM|nr:phage tail spike protein [Anaerococcus tetradius]KWZ77569.1 phage minor structural protein [Anaerococcus tetradius]